MKLKNRNIGPNYYPLVITEIGINHGGQIDVAKKMVYEAAKAGAECVKHQTHFVEDEMTEDAKNIFPPNANASIWEVIEKCALNRDEEFALKQYAPQDLKKIIRDSLTKLNTLYVYNSSDFSFKKKKGIELNSLKNEKMMKVFSNSNLIWTGPRAYFTSDQNNLFLISGTGILMYVNKSNINLQDSEIKFKTINTNLEDILKNYKEDKFYSFTS